jgi:hypothetical protein
MAFTTEMPTSGSDESTIEPYYALKGIAAGKADQFLRVRRNLGDRSIREIKSWDISAVSDPPRTMSWTIEAISERNTAIVPLRRHQR